MATEAPSAVLSGFAAAADRLDACNFAACAPQVGDQAPDFALPDHRGEEVYFSTLLRGGPVVLIFYRGEWCPYCNLQLRTFQAHLDPTLALGAQLVAVSPQTRDHSLSMAEKNDLGFPVLSDVGANVIDRYGLKYEVDAETRALFEAVHDPKEVRTAGGRVNPFGLAAGQKPDGVRTDVAMRRSNLRPDRPRRWRVLRFCPSRDQLVQKDLNFCPHDRRPLPGIDKRSADDYGAEIGSS